MAKIDLGTKRVCPGCAAKYYDLGRKPAKCPKCDFEFDPDEDLSRPVVKPRARKPAMEEAPEPEPAEKEAATEPEATEPEATKPETAEIGGEPSFPAGESDGEGDDESPDAPSDESDGFSDSEEQTTETAEDDNTKLLIDEEEDEGFGEINVTKDEAL